MSGTGQKVCGGGGGYVVCKPTLVLSLGQAEQLEIFQSYWGNIKGWTEKLRNWVYSSKQNKNRKLIK